MKILIVKAGGIALVLLVFRFFPSVYAACDYINQVPGACVAATQQNAFCTVDAQGHGTLVYGSNDYCLDYGAQTFCSTGAGQIECTNCGSYNEAACCAGLSTCVQGPVPTPAPDGGGGGSSPNPVPTYDPSCTFAYWSPWTTCQGSPASKMRFDNCGITQHATCLGTINSRAVVVHANATCADIQASAVGVAGTVHQFTAGSASQPAPQSQSGASYVTFSNILGGSYTASPTVPANYNLVLACWSKQLNSPNSGTGSTESLSEPTDADTLTWDLGYTAGSPWVQTQGGNVYAAGNVTSFVPVGISPRVFALTGQ